MWYHAKNILFTKYYIINSEQTLNLSINNTTVKNVSYNTAGAKYGEIAPGLTKWGAIPGATVYGEANRATGATGAANAAGAGNTDGAAKVLANNGEGATAGAKALATGATTGAGATGAKALATGPMIACGVFLTTALKPWIGSA